MSGAPAAQRTRVLLVDDHPENLVALESVLADLGPELVRASSGREALRRLLTDDFAVILLDVQMPGMDGFETAAMIRARERTSHVPIIFLTAINKAEFHVSRGYRLGAVDYVFKPFEPEVLRAKVAVFVQLAQQRAELQAEVEQRRVAEERARRAEEAVRGLNQSLERRVQERTAALKRANAELEQEILERKRAEEERSRLLDRERAARGEAEAARGRLEFLVEASAALAQTLDPGETASCVAGLGVPFLADAALLHLPDPAGVLVLAGSAGLEEVDALTDWEPAVRVLSGGQGERLGDGDFTLPRAAIAAPQPHAAIIMPLLARGQPIGTLTLLALDRERVYGDQEFALAQDLARRAAAAVDNARLFSELREAALRKDQFLAMLAHELRNPLAAIANADYALAQFSSDDPRLARLHSIIDRQTHHLTRLVDDLLDVSRITQGKINLRRETVNLALVAQRAVEALRPLLDERGHHLCVRLPEEPLWVDADPTRLEQVVSNLLTNAAKYTEPGGRIWVRADREETPSGPQVCLSVRDTGMGLPADLLPHVFDLFTQSERTLDRAQGGLGIGLSLVRSLVAMHGGSVGASSDGPGKGSEFFIRLPLLKKKDRRKRKERGRAVHVVPPAATPRRVLVVEDNPDAAETLCEILDLWGHDATVVYSGDEAVSVWDERGAEVILMDIGLPGMNGYDAARAIRERQAAGGRLRGPLTLIALSGYGQPEDQQRAKDAGFDAYLTKPVDPGALSALLGAHASHNGRREDALLTGDEEAEGEPAPAAGA